MPENVKPPVDIRCSTCGHGYFSCAATIDALRAQLDAVTKERDHWKANHTRELEVNRALRDRPDLGDRATRVQSLIEHLIEQRASLATALSERTHELDVAQKNNQELLNRIVKTDACWDAMRLELDAALTELALQREINANAIKDECECEELLAAYQTDETLPLCTLIQAALKERDECCAQIQEWREAMRDGTDDIKRVAAERDAATLRAEKAERYGAPVEGAMPLPPFAGKSCAKHNAYWTTAYGACMACRAVDADARIATLETALGEMPKTADGVPVGDCARVWIVNGDDERAMAQVRLDKCGYTCDAEGFHPVEECYSTEAAARRAIDAGASGG